MPMGAPLKHCTGEGCGNQRMRSTKSGQTTSPGHWLSRISLGKMLASTSVSTIAPHCKQRKDSPYESSQSVSFY